MDTVERAKKKKLLILIVFCEGEREREREGLKARTLPPLMEIRVKL